MADRADTAHAEDPFNEAVATTGLFLLVTAIIAVAFALASWTMSETLFAVLGGAALVRLPARPAADRDAIARKDGAHA